MGEGNNIFYLIPLYDTILTPSVAGGVKNYLKIPSKKVKRNLKGKDPEIIGFSTRWFQKLLEIIN